MKALIVGGKGQLGTTLTRIAPSFLSVAALDLPAIDITDPQSIGRAIQNEEPDIVINASAYTAVDRAEKEADLAYAINADGPKNLAVAIKGSGIRLIHVSTDYVFDGTACTPYPADAPCTPLGVYGKSKRKGETHVRDILDDPVIIRTSWLYSRFGNNFVLTMLRLMQEKDELKVVADQVGSPTWATTLAQAIWAVVPKDHVQGIYHWSDAGVASWYDFAVAIQEEALATGMLQKRIPIHPIPTEEFPTPAQRPAYSVLDCTATWKDWSTAPVHWRVALRRMLWEGNGRPAFI